MFSRLEQGTVTSLQKQGAVNRHHGFRSRPRLVNQTLVLSEIFHPMKERTAAG